ncbi:alpha-L-rhamnosidase [Micromonospora pallida]|uniref:Alpha-L-rhamnosidase n=1 Tax=Micromonospora pallida TaxID=145854 RepID=A0A1C6SGC4_9ACTN|nr:trehalase family glycosidase [Micromonospora pallida]SCL28502.1 alpha-L-rhamnosidase [Micromonospora pallida]
MPHPHRWSVTRRRKLLAAALAATLTSTLAAQPAQGEPTAGREPQVDLAPLSRPFVMPGFKEQEFNGALLVGEGETRFSVSVDLLTKDNKIVHENMVPNIRRIGPIATDGSYYEIELSTDDRVLTAEKIGGLQATLDHPESWSAEDVAAARTQLPTLKAQYERNQRNRRNIVIRFARVSPTELVGSVTALDDDTTVFLDASAPWLEPSRYVVAGDRAMTGTTTGLTDPDRQAHLRVDTSVPADSSASYASLKAMLDAMVGKNGAAGDGAAAMRWELDRDETVTFTARMGDATLAASSRSQAEALAILTQARSRVNDGSVDGDGSVGQTSTYMRDAMALNANYDEKFNRSFVMWGLGGGGDDIFKGWDSAWDGITALSLDPALALDHIRDFYDQGGARYDQLHAGPMHAYLAWRAYVRTGDRSILDLVYPLMVPYIDRMREFDTDGDGLLETPWAGERLGGRGNHLGLDDSPQYYNAIQVPTNGSDNRDNTNLTDVALNSYYGLFAENLSQMAEVLGKDADRTRFAQLHAKLEQRMNDRLWNAERGLYLNRYLDGTWEPTTTPTVFYPLFGGLAAPDRAEILVRDHLLNPDEFWGEYAIPSVARNDPAFCSAGRTHEVAPPYRYFQRYNDEDACEEWKGAVWPPMNATVYDGLKRYGFDKPAAELATKSSDLWLSTWEEMGWFPEYWDAEPGQVVNGAATDTAWRTYSWSNLMPLMGTQELIADEPWGDPRGMRFGTLGLPGTNSVNEVPLHGHRYKVVAGPKSTVVHQDGRPLFMAQGARVVVRDFVVADGTATFTVKSDGEATVKVFPEGGGKPRTVQVPAGTTQVRL